MSRAQASFGRGRFVEAQEQLRGLTGEQAVALRGQVAAAQARREAGLAEVARILEQAPGPPLAELERLLFQGPGRIDDRRVAESIDAARSLLSDQYAEARAKGMRWGLAEEWSSAPISEEDIAPPLALQLKRDSQSDAPTEIAHANNRTPSSREIDERRNAVIEEARPDSEPDAAHTEALEVDSWRDQLAHLSSVDELLTWSLDHEDSGELELSLAGLDRVRQVNASDAELAEAAREEQRLQQRLALRKELTRAIQSRRSSYAKLGVTDVVARGIQFDGSLDLTHWEDLSAEDWKALAGKVTLTWRARMGLAMEYLAHGRENWADEILVRQWRGDPSQADSVFQVVAWYRDEPMPPGGYVYRNELWRAADGVQASDAPEIAEQLSNRLKSAGKDARDRVFAQLLALGRDDLCRDALATRWHGALQHYSRASGRRELERLIQARREIDGMRRDILDRIQDVFQYPADLSQPGAAARKQASQTFIDQATRDLKRSLKSVHPVLIRPGLRSFLDEVHWLLAREQQLGLVESLRPGEVPAWALAIGSEERTLTIQTFAWNPSNREAQERDRAVRKRNAALFENNPRKPAERATSPAEIRLVKLTNDYRMLLGRPALAWDFRIQAAAWDHSRYMSKTGDFGHIEPEPDRKTTTDRLARRGYIHPGGENCTVDISGADAAHQAWLHSPGHHRNIVAAANTQIACSNVDKYWTQVFGSDSAFLEELKAWSD